MYFRPVLKVKSRNITYSWPKTGRINSFRWLDCGRFYLGFIFYWKRYTIDLETYKDGDIVMTIYDKRTGQIRYG